MAGPVRRNVAHLTPAERQAYAQALRDVDLQSYADGVSYWDKQDQIHEGTHNHQGNSFIPWHRELVNRFEKLIQQVNPDMALHYWDWTQDLRAADDGQGGTVDLMTNATFGTANGMVAGTLAPLHNGGNTAGARPTFGGPFTQPPAAITRGCQPGAPPVASNANIIGSTAGVPQAQQWTTFRQALESSHDSAHIFFGSGSIFNPHTAFEDPFVFLLHSNVDRLFAMWQTQPGEEWRLDPDQVYGDQKDTSDSRGILRNLQPWDGTVEFGAPIPPWTGGSSDIVVKNSRHTSVVQPPCYDTLPLAATQEAPVPGDPIRFIDVPTGEGTARALRIRVRGCHGVTANASLAGDPAFSLLASTGTVISPEPDGFEVKDLLVWVLFAAGAVGSTPSATLTVDIPGVLNVVVPIESTVIDKPTVASSLVLDRSGSMDLPSGMTDLSRVQVLRNAAPLFAQLLDPTDGIGVVRFDTDAVEAEPVQVAGPEIGGIGRSEALTAIANHVTNQAGLTAIGDGVEAAANQLNAATGFTGKATVVFTDGHETEDKYIDDVTDLIDSTVFAVGLGTADQLNPAGLDDLADSTGGYLLLTGNAGSDDLLLLQKYFAQIIAGVANNEIVVDPDGFVAIGSSTEVPFDLAEGDTRCDAIVLSPLADALDAELIAPDGTSFDASNGVILTRTPVDLVLRLTLPAPPSTSTGGQWRVRLMVDGPGLEKVIEELRRREDVAGLNRLERHGVGFTVTVQARSNVRLSVRTVQTSRRPGGIATVMATLTDFGIPLASSAKVTASVDAPDGSVSTITLTELEPGRYQADVPTAAPGVYRVLVTAKGHTLRGEPFTREQLRTLAVWRAGDDPRPPAQDPGADPPGLCELLKCLLSGRFLAEAARRAGIDLDEVRRCLDETC
jgi:Common central domain of tyrosinase/von Willebrand factor type A domain